MWNRAWPIEVNQEDKRIEWGRQEQNSSLGSQVGHGDFLPHENRIEKVVCCGWAIAGVCQGKFGDRKDMQRVNGGGAQKGSRPTQLEDLEESHDFLIL